MVIFENLDKMQFFGVGPYSIPEIEPTEINTDNLQLIPFNYAKTTKDKSGKGCHFFLDDYQFVRLWNDADRYVPILSGFDFVLSPDFSMYTDMPPAMQIYNHYRKHWLAAYWQQHGIKVIPTICWSDEDSFRWCFDGEPTHSIVAVSSVGCLKQRGALDGFMAGYNEMLRRLEPSKVIFYGSVPDGVTGDVIAVQPYQSKYGGMKNGR